MSNPLISLLERDSGRRVRVVHSDTCKFDLGLEIGTLSTFCSFENNKLGNALVEQEAFGRSDSGDWHFSSQVKFSDAHLKVTEVCHVDRTCGRRNLEVEALADSRLMDVVLRFVIAKDRVRSAFIGNREITHRRRNRYHQYDFDQVILNLVNGTRLTFHPVGAALPAGFEHVVYLRDEPGRWILHVRALALAPSHYVLKGCSRWYNRPFPLMIQSMVLGSTWLRSRLLYVRERISQRIPIQVNGAADLAKGRVIQLAVHWTCGHDRR